jgi:hypothetical protein
LSTSVTLTQVFGQLAGSSTIASYRNISGQEEKPNTRRSSSGEAIFSESQAYPVIELGSTARDIVMAGALVPGDAYTVAHLQTVEPGRLHLPICLVERVLRLLFLSRRQDRVGSEIA